MVLENNKIIRRDHLAIVILTVLTMDLQINMKKKIRKKSYTYVLLLID
jgi:hypothetical protein